MSSTPTAPPETGGAPRRENRPGLALFVIALAQLMVVLDATIVSVALPTIQKALGFTTENLSWMVNAYTLTFGGLLLLGGRAGDILGRRRMFIVGIGLFTLASLAGGLATSQLFLLAARALQGVGAAIISPTVLALIATNFSDEKARNRAFGVFAAVSGAGAAIGLLAGGVLTQWLSWRWILFVNAPIGVLLILLTPLYIVGSPRQPGRFDMVGAATSTVGMVALVYGFISASRDGWRDVATVTSFAVALVLLVAFIGNEARSSQPITPLHLFADRNRSGIYVVAFCLTGALMGLFFFLTLFMQNVLRYDPLQAGLAFLPVSVAVIAAAAQVSRVLPRTGLKTPLLVGMALNALAFLWLSRLSVESTFLVSLFGPMVIFGIGTGLVFVPLTMLGVSNVTPEETGAASGLLNTTQQVGGSLGLAILVTVFGAVGRNLAADGATDPGTLLVDSMTTTFLVGAAFCLLALVVAVAAVRAPRGLTTASTVPSTGP